MCAASDLGARLEAAAVPLLPEVESLAAAGHVPGGTGRNLAAVRAHLRFEPADPDADALLLNILADPQTSGGLLLACPRDAAEGLVEDLAAAGHTPAIVGETTRSVPAGEIELVRGA